MSTVQALDEILPYPPTFDDRMGAHLVEVDDDRAARDAILRWGRSSVSPFTLGPDCEAVSVGAGGVAGWVRRGRWAVMATDPVAPPGAEELAIDEALAALAERRLQPVIAAAVDPAPYQRRGLCTVPIADDPIIDLSTFGLAGRRRANIRHSVTSARRTGLRVVDWSAGIAGDAAAVSARWLATKRGGEMGFTLGRFVPSALEEVDCRMALDADDRVVGFVTWRPFDGGRGRVLDLMRRDPDAPNPTMDLLIAETLLEFAQAGVSHASLACVPRDRGRLAQWLYPTVSLRRYKDKFAPTWQPRYLVAPSRARLAGALAAVARAYSPHGLMAALRRNR